MRIHQPPSVLAGADLDGAGLAGGLYRLTGVADKVRDDPVKLLAVASDGEAGRHVSDEIDKISACEFFAVGHLGGEACQHEAGQGGRRFFGLAEGQGRFAERHGPADRGDEFRRGAGNAGVLAGFHPVGEQLRGGQDVAQVVADAGDGAAKLGEPVLLFQGAGQLGCMDCRASSASCSSTTLDCGTMKRRASSGASA
jgi:hypothetical protein